MSMLLPLVSHYKFSEFLQVKTNLTVVSHGLQLCKYIASCHCPAPVRSQIRETRCSSPLQSRVSGSRGQGALQVWQCSRRQSRCIRGLPETGSTAHPSTWPKHWQAVDCSLSSGKPTKLVHPKSGCCFWKCEGVGGGGRRTTRPGGDSELIL